MPALVTNNATTTLASGITAAAATLSVSPGDGALFPSPTGANYFYCTLAGTAGVEIVKVTARATDTFTIVRAQDGTTAKAFSAGETVELRPVAALFSIDALLPDQTSAANKLLVSNGATASWSSNLSGLTLAAPTLTGLSIIEYAVVTGSVNVLGGGFPGVGSSQFFGTSGRFGLVRTASAVNERVWDFSIGSNTLTLRTVDDADAAPVAALTFTRSSTTVTAMTCGASQFFLPSLSLVTAPALAFTGDTDTGICRTTSDTFCVAAGGAVGFTVSSAAMYVGTSAAPVQFYSHGLCSASVSAATTAGGPALGGFYMGTAGIRVTWGSGAPTTSAPQGSLYLRTDGSSTSTRAYINTNGSTTWTAITTAT